MLFHYLFIYLSLLTALTFPPPRCDSRTSRPSHVILQIMKIYRTYLNVTRRFVEFLGLGAGGGGGRRGVEKKTVMKAETLKTQVLSRYRHQGESRGVYSGVWHRRRSIKSQSEGEFPLYKARSIRALWCLTLGL